MKGLEAMFNNSDLKKICAVLLSASMLLLCSCGNTQKIESPSDSAQDVSAKASSAQDVSEDSIKVSPEDSSKAAPEDSSKAVKLEHRYASEEEGRSLLLSNDEYYKGFNQNKLEYVLKKKNPTMEEYFDFAGEQVRAFTEDEKALIDGYFEAMADSLNKNGYSLPEMDEIIMIKTTMAEEDYAGAYTHGTQIYIADYLLEALLSDDENDKKEEIIETMKLVLWHELFHCITRCYPEFRSRMYSLIHFTVTDEDYVLPPSVLEYHISNPDVEHHNSYATFIINGKNTDCFVDMVTTKHFENEDDIFFDFTTTALIPIDGTDIYYTPEQADNFFEVFGENTDYVVDPEECMADNFSFAMEYGMDGPDGEGYKSPEIIEGIISLLKEKRS